MENSREQKASLREGILRGMEPRDTSLNAANPNSNFQAVGNSRKTEDLSHKLVKYRHFLQSLLNDSTIGVTLGSNANKTLESTLLSNCERLLKEVENQTDIDADLLASFANALLSLYIKYSRLTQTEQ